MIKTSLQISKFFHKISLIDIVERAMSNNIERFVQKL